MTEAEQLARKMQREDIERRPYLFARDPRSDRWAKNVHGTVMTPVWAACSPYEEKLLNDRG